MWIPTPKKNKSSNVPVDLKASVSVKADTFIQNVLIPKYIKVQNIQEDHNYLVKIYSKWYRHYFYFCATYYSPGVNAISDSFETKFARMEYVGNGNFNISYMRHNGLWWEVAQDKNVCDSLTIIQDEGCFMP